MKFDFYDTIYNILFILQFTIDVGMCKLGEIGCLIFLHTNPSIGY